MLIKFGATFQLKGIGIKDSFEIDGDRISIKDFLLTITEFTEGTIEFFEEDGSIDDQNYIVYVNEKMLLGLPGELNEDLHDGDAVYIAFPMLGGG